MDTRPPQSSSLLTSAVTNTDFYNSTTPKPTQLCKKELKQLNVKIDKNDDINNRFSIYHQNIRGLKGKITEFLLSLPTEAPHLICLTEHHLKDYELASTHVPEYKLGAAYCRVKQKQGGVCIYVRESIKFTTINLLKHTKEQDIEIAAIQLNIQKSKIIVICVYRAPCGNLDLFLNKLETILNSLHRHNIEFIICGDININYLETSSKKTQLDNLLGTYNLRDTVFFPQELPITQRH
jgi:exonuclease III